MAPWYRFMLEAKCNDEWFNIDHWCRRADGTMKHEILLAASERDLFGCDTTSSHISRVGFTFTSWLRQPEKSYRQKTPHLA